MIHIILKAILLICLIIFNSSCEDRQAKRQYEEISIPSPQSASAVDPNDFHALLKEMLAKGEDPHAFMRENPMNQEIPMAMGDQIPMPSGNSVSPVIWEAPVGWQEKPASGMRLASFVSDSSPKLDVSIVTLGGGAGGLSANINRWAKQINLPEMSEEELKLFLEKQEKFTTAGNLSVMFVDFTALQNNSDPSLPSLLAAIVEAKDNTVFVKMTGTLSDISKNREIFKTLCLSLKNKE